MAIFDKGRCPNLCYMFQPSTKGYKHHQHGSGFKESHGASFLLHDHGHNDHHTGVHVGDRGGKNNQHVHVCCSVSDRLESLYVEVSSTNKLKKSSKYVVLNILINQKFLASINRAKVAVYVCFECTFVCTDLYWCCQNKHKKVVQ